MSNWKTTLGGFAGGLASVLSGVTLFLNGETTQGVSLIVTGMGIIWAGYHAKDK